VFLGRVKCTINGSLLHHEWNGKSNFNFRILLSILNERWEILISIVNSFSPLFQGQNDRKFRSTDEQTFNVLWMLNREIISFVKVLNGLIQICNRTNEDADNCECLMIMTRDRMTKNIILL
jgi:hypothetical protein